MFLGRARLAYINHGAWMKEMPSRPDPRKATVRIFRLLFGRFRLVLASEPGEVTDYERWKGPDVRVVCLGYPRSSVLDESTSSGLNPWKVGLWPTWKEFPDPSYGSALAHRIHDLLQDLGVARPCVEYRPHPLTKDIPLTLGVDDGRRPGLVITDFSSVAFDQAYLGGRLVLYSQVAGRYLATHGIRQALRGWLRNNLVDNEDSLLRLLRAMVADGNPGAPPGMNLRPFDAAAFWRLLSDPDAV